MPEDKDDIPRTLRKSHDKIQRAYKKALENSHEQYGSEERAHRTAWYAVKNIAEKKGDHWVLKEDTGPSDPRSKQSQKAKQVGKGETYSGIDVEGSSREELENRARKTGVKGYTQMSKKEIADKLEHQEPKRL